MLAIRDSKRLRAIIMTVLGKGGPSLFVDLGGVQSEDNRLALQSAIGTKPPIALLNGSLASLPG